MLRNFRGQATIASVLVSVVILSITLYAYSHLSAGGRRVSIAKELEQEAQFYVIELLEFFRSMTNAQLKAYLSVNPTGAGNPYPLCTLINLSNTSKNISINPDPIATLTTQNNLSRFGFANRYYKVDVVDRITSTVNSATTCNQMPQNYTLAANEAYWVTVYVDYNDQKKTLKTIQSSSLITDR